MLTMKSDRFNKIWLIVPFMSYQTRELIAFADKHKWFIEQGGSVLYKASGTIDSLIADRVEAAGATLIQRVDSGLYDAWNQAMDYLWDAGIRDGAYISFLGLDDEIDQDFCVEVAQLANSSEQFDFIYGNGRSILNGRFKDRVSPSTPALFGKDNYVFDVPHPGMMNRWAAVSHYRFDTRYRLAADFDFYIGIAQRKAVSFRHVQKIQTMIGADGVSNSAKAKDIYIREWSSISTARNVRLNLENNRMGIMSLISRFPRLFDLLRRLYWALTAQKL